MKAAKGFTLVELAISLVVIGLLIGLGVTLVGPLATATKVRESKENLDGAVESLNSWAAGNNSLPNGAGFPAVVKSPQDAWGHNFVYLYDATLFSATPSNDTLCGRKTTSLTLQTTNPPATIANVAYVMLSPGDDSTIQTTLATTATVPAIPPTLNGTPVTSGSAIPLNTLASATGTVVLDTNNSDIVRWVTLDELRTKVGCEGAQMRIVNNELPYGYVSSKYVAKLLLNGGVTDYKWCVSGLPPGLVAVALPGGATMGSCTVPANCAGLTSDSNWVTATPPVFLNISGIPTAQGSYQINLMAHDSQGSSLSQNNCSSKTFALTINPQ